MTNSRLGIGPMSPEIIEAVFRYSHYHRKELMLIASKNQIDHGGGYVNNWTTKEYMQFVDGMRSKYPNSNVKICRDHCGPGFNGNYDLQDTYRTIESDLKCGFDLIHIDFCHFRGGRDERLEEMKKAIQYCRSRNPKIMLEIGTDENLGTNFSVGNMEEMENEIEYFKEFKPVFFVVQTGSLVKEINQVGNFNEKFIKNIAEKLRGHGLRLKEHNADYLSKKEILRRKGIVEAMNIAPQLGALQTSILLEKCLLYGVDYSAFFNEVIAKAKWTKWLHTNTADNKMLCFLIAGHYHFSSENCKAIVAQIEEHEDLKENIITEIMGVIEHYEP